MKVSILIPNYNHGKYLSNSINSACSQSYKNLEIIIVDDASTDNSAEIIKKHASIDQRIKYQIKSINSGFTETFSQCYKLCSGDIVYGLASDDYICNAHFIDRAVRLFTDNPEMGIVWARTQLVYEDGEPFTVLGSSQRLLFEKGPEFLIGFLRNENFVAGYSAVFKKKCLEEIGGFQFDMGPQCDYFPNHAVPSVFGGAFIPEIMTYARVFRDGSNYSTNTTEMQRIQRHCEFEKRMRNLGVAEIPEDLWLSWRERLIKDIATNSQEFAHTYFRDNIGEL